MNKRSFLLLWAALFLLLLSQPVAGFSVPVPKTPHSDFVTYTFKAQGTASQASLPVPSIGGVKSIASGSRISWSSAAGADGYILYRALPGDAYYKAIKVLPGATTLTYTDREVTSGEPYHYTLRAYAHRDSGWLYSGYRIPYLHVYVSRAPKPSLKSAEKGVLLQWEPLSGVSGYHIYRRDLPNGTLQRLADVPGSFASYQDISAVSGRSYAYCLRSYVLYRGQTFLSSRYSPEATITYQKPAPTPTPGGKGIYRALLVGEAEYESTMDLKGPPFDVKTLSCTLTGKGYQKVVTKLNLKKSQLLGAIRNTFRGATEGDVSLFYYSGHGHMDEDSTYSGGLLAVDEVYITPAELASALGAIPGRVIVLLDSCGSGATITDVVEEINEEPSVVPNIASFNRQICQAFEAQDEVLTPRYGELKSDHKFYVITSCKVHQSSIELTTGHLTFGWFTYALCQGAGHNYKTPDLWSGEFPADFNADKAITLEEAYCYARDTVKGLGREYNLVQNVQRYPKKSSLVVLQAP